MNNIYKVIWSKAKNCYVVASEIARSHTKSATGSEKIGGVTRRSLLASLMALSLLCGGLGVAEAAVVHVDEVPGGTKAVYTTDETYTMTQADAKYATQAALGDYAKSADVYSKTEADAKYATQTALGDYAKSAEVYSKTEADAKYATQAALGDYAKSAEVYSKTEADAKYATQTALGDYAKSAEVYSKTEADAKYATQAALGDYAKSADVYSKTEADGKFATQAELNAKADVTALGEYAKTVDVNNALSAKADKTDLDTANGKITDLQAKTANLSADGKELTGMTTVSGTTVSGTNVEAGALKVTGEISNGAGVTTTLADIKDSMDRTDMNKTWIGKLNERTTNITHDATGTSVDGVTFNAGAVTGVTSINGTKIGMQESGKYIRQDNSIWGNMKIVDTQVETNEKNIETNKTAITNLDTKVGTVGTGTYLDPNKSIGENLGRLDAGLKKEVGDRTAAVEAEKTAREAEDTNLSNRIGTVTEDGTYIKKSTTNNVSENLKVLDTQAKTNAEAIAKETADRKAAIGELAVNGNYIEKDKNVSDNLVKLDNQAKANADEIVKTNERTGGIARNTEKTQTTIEGSVKVDNQGNVKDVKGLSAETITTTGNATIGGDLKVAGTITTDKMVFGDPATNNYTEIDKGKVTSKNLVVNGAGETISSSSTFDVEKNEVGFTNTATGDHSYHKQTADGIKGYVTDKDGNKTYTKVTATENSFQVQDKDGKNKNHQVNTKDSSVTEITNGDGKTTKTEQTATDITNTAKDGTITNDAKDIVNNATGDMTNNVGGNLSTTVGGNEIHEVKGTKTETVEGKVTENFKNGQETNVTGNQDIHVTGKQTNTVGGGQENIISGGQTNTITGGQINNITGDQTTNVSGTQTINATDINRNASSGMIDTVDNAYGTNKETKVAGSTTTEVSIKGTGESGTYIRGATEARDYIIKGTLSNSETKTAEATSTEITDGNGKTSATIQDKTQISGSVINGTSSAVSNVKADSIDTAVKEGTNTSLISQKKDSITSAVGNGTTSTVIQQGDKDITIASNGGTVGIVGKDIINNATDEITNTAGTKITDKVGNNTRVIDQTSITDTVGTASRKIEDGKITDTAGDSTVTTENGKGTTFAKAGSAAYSTEAGATKDTNIAGNHITTGRVDANELGVSDKDDQGNTADLSVKAGEGIKGSATDKDGNKTSTKVTATENSFQVQDKDGKIKNHQVNTKDSSENTITNGDKTNTVTSTADGTTFNNSKANTAFEGGTYTDTTIKGNTITTGKVTMDYAEVMRDLGVNGNANITGKTTTGSLEVKGESKLTGNVTMESNATVKKDLTVNGTTNLKDTNVGGKLDVTGKATFSDDVDIKKNLSVVGDVTANSYKVGDKTYISAAGINANNQKITNVADGSISEGSKDAVNGGQLYNVKNDLEGKVNKVGANAAAMANLHPMEFDPDSKWNIAAAIGNYGSETAAALGAFYRPNDDVMVNLSTAFGTGENMVGGGVSVRLGKGGNKLSREETNALKAQVADLTARMDALLSVLNLNMSKDFPDVPENHWAYEAVSRLAGNDIVQGYPDGEFHGERTMTRYEMAEIIYNALSRGAEAEKELVEEFKPELQAMAASEKATAERAEG